MTVQRYLLGFLSLLFAASLGAFLLYVPMLPAIVVALILMSLLSMFALGFIARRPIHPRAFRGKFGNGPQIVDSRTAFFTGHSTSKV